MDPEKTSAFEVAKIAHPPEHGHSFAVDQPGRVWMVHQGSVDVFLVERQDGAPRGARHHVVRVEQGQAIFGFQPAAANGMGLLANPGPGAQVEALTAEQLQAANISADGAGQRLLEQWVEALCSVAAEASAPHQFQELQSDQALVTEEKPVVVLPAQGVAWACQREGTSAFLGNEELGRMEPGELFPVTRVGWFVASAHSRLDVLGPASLPPLGQFWNSLQKFQEMIFAYLLWQHREREEVARQRFAAQSQANDALVDAALHKLTAPLTGDEQALTEAEVGIQDPLVLACQAVGRAMRMQIRPVPKALERVRQRDPVAGIARASRVRHRQVILKGDWWRQEGGPLVAFMGEQKEPVALLPETKRGFLLYNPSTRTHTHITPELAAQVNAVAYTFYRPFPEKPMDFKSITRFGIEECRSELIMIGLMGLAVGLLALVTPILTGIIFDTVIPGAQRSTLAEFTAFLVVAAVATAMFSLTRSLATLRLEGKVDGVVQAAIWDRLLALPVPFFRRFTSGDLARRSLGISQIRQTLTGPVLTSVLSGIFSLASLALMFYYSWRLALIGTLVLTFSFGVFLILGYLQVGFLREATEIGGQISGMTLQFINGVNKFRISGAEKRAFAAWAQMFARQKRLIVKVRYMGGTLEVFNAGFPVVATAVIFYFAAQLMRGAGPARMTTGEFLAFDAAFIQLSVAIVNLSTAVTSVLGVVPLYERAKPILQAQPEIPAARNNPGELAGGIEVNHVNFRYREDGPRVLRDISVSIAPGQFVAFVGPSGSGKSTMFRLLLGFEEPESGAIYYDGQALAELDVQAVRQQIGVVLQNGRLMTGDIYHNIVGSSALTVEDAWEAARMAGLEEDVRAMPMGMHTIVSESGGLSGGQRQRLMIARAIVTRPRIVLFDEATSALDNQTQAIVSRSLQRLNATRVVIAHRLTTVQHAEHIYVLDKGVLIESGNYEELMAQDGLFARLARRQLS